MGFIDTHAHILPGLDDGPRNVEESLALLRAVFEGGTVRIVATSHLFHETFPDVTKDRLQRAFDRLLADVQVESGKEGWAFLAHLRIDLGAEHYLSPGLRTALKHGGVLPLNGSRYLLVEGPLSLSGLSWKDSLSSILSAGYFPVIAHPERYWPYQRDPSQLEEVVEMGCLLQVNAASLLGEASRQTTRTARRLLRSGLVHLVASDTHHAEYRPPYLKELAEWLPGGAAGDIVQRLLSTNPARLLDDADPPDPVSAPSRLWSRLVDGFSRS